MWIIPFLFPCSFHPPCRLFNEGWIFLPSFDVGNDFSWCVEWVLEFIRVCNRVRICVSWSTGCGCGCGLSMWRWNRANVFDVIISVYTRITRTKPLYFKWCSKVGLATKLRQSGSQWRKKNGSDENRKKKSKIEANVLSHLFLGLCYWFFLFAFRFSFDCSSNASFHFRVFVACLVLVGLLVYLDIVVIGDVNSNVDAMVGMGPNGMDTDDVDMSTSAPMYFVSAPPKT